MGAHSLQITKGAVADGKNSQNVACQKKEQLLANIEVVGEERRVEERRVVEVVGLVQTNQLLPAKKQQHWYTSHPSLAAHKYGDISSS